MNRFVFGSTLSLGVSLLCLSASPAAAQTVIIDEQFDGPLDLGFFTDPNDDSVFVSANELEPGIVGRTLFRSPSLVGQAGLPFSPPPVLDGVLQLRVETFNPFDTPAGTPAAGSLFLADEIRTRRTFAPTIETGFSFETRARFVDDQTNPLSPGIIGGIFLFGLAPFTGTTRDEVDFELLTNFPQNEITTNIFNDDGFTSSGNFVIQELPGFDITEFNDFRIESTLDSTRFFVNDNLIREETTDLAIEPQDFRLNANVQGPAFAAAFSPLLQPTADPTQNETFIFEIDSLVISEFDTGLDLPGPPTPIFDLTGGNAPDTVFNAFNSGAPSELGFDITSNQITPTNFDGILLNDQDLLNPGVVVSPDSVLLLEATVGDLNESDLNLGLIVDTVGIFFVNVNVTISQEDLLDDGQAILDLSEAFASAAGIDLENGPTEFELISAFVNTPTGSSAPVDITIQRLTLLPEPASALLIAGGGLALLGGRRRSC